MTDSAPPLLIAPPPPGWGAQAVADPEADKLARRALVFGLLSFLINPLALCTIIGIVYGRKALKLGTAYRGMAITGIVAGSAGLITAIALFVVGVLIGLHARDAALQHSLESSIMRSSTSAQGAALTDVACPVPHDPGPGTSLICSARTTAGTAVSIEVDFTSSTTFTARLLQQG